MYTFFSQRNLTPNGNPEVYFKIYEKYKKFLNYYRLVKDCILFPFQTDSQYMLSLYKEIEVSQNMVKTDLVSFQKERKPTLPTQKNPMYPF